MELNVEVPSKKKRVGQNKSRFGWMFDVDQWIVIHPTNKSLSLKINMFCDVLQKLIPTIHCIYPSTPNI